MHLHLHLPQTMIFIAAATVLTLLIHAPTLSYAVNAQFLACNTTFKCGNISGIGYPFWTANRPPNCGFPGAEFQLVCSGNAAEITIMKQTYKVLQIHGGDRAITVARKDYPSSLCLTTNATLNFTIFGYTRDSANLTLFSGCTDLYSDRYDLDPAEVNCGDSGYGYYATAGNVVYDYLGGAGCAKRVVVPFNKSSFPNSGGSVVTVENAGAAIENGFGVNWYARNEMCDACVRSGGACGHHSTSVAFACYCTDKPYTKTCGGGGKPVSLIIGIAMGGVGIVGILLGLGAFFLIQRRKQIAAQSVSKDISVPTNGTPSSKGLATSTTYFSQSNPSYLSSKSDLEKGSTYFGVQVFSYTELEEATDSFDSSKELGDGGFGVVYYGVLHDGRVVAVKRLFENNFKRVEQFMNEVEILTRLRHQHLVTLYGCTSRRSRELLLVYEYISNGTVADHLHGKQAKSGLLSWTIRLKIAVETADALAYLHKSDIIHRDVKTNNILLDSNFCVKVADFGLSRLFPNDVTHVSTAPQGTPGYVDPEYYQCYQLTNKSDVYSFGVVLTELLSSKQAVDITRHRHDINLANMAVNKIQNHSLHELVDPSIGFGRDYNVRRMVTSVAELAFRCLQQDRDMRPSMDEVLEVLRGIQSEEVKEQEVEIVDIEADDAGLLKSNDPPPLSPDSVATDKWVSSSTATDSF